MRNSVYLDFAASTPVDPEVIIAMQPYAQEEFANPSSLHAPGRRARGAVDAARSTIADMLHCAPQEIVFTSGGTESISLAIFGSVRRGTHDAMIASSIEHEAVLASMKYLQTHGHVLHCVAPKPNGIINAADVARNVTSQTRLVSIMTANNEIGTIQDIADIAQSVKERNPNVLVHTDACQAVMFVSLYPTEMNIDLCSLSASKMHGPKGIGALIIRHGVDIEPQLRGGSQERGLRAGTEPVALIVGFAAALQLSAKRRDRDVRRMKKLRDRLIDGIYERIPGVRLNGDREKRLPNNANIFFPESDGELLLANFDAIGISASLGSACAAGVMEPSHVLLGIGCSKEEARQSVRFTLGHTTTEQEIDTVLNLLPSVVKKSKQQT